jgi:carboxymethylenebutenolidase
MEPKELERLWSDHLEGEFGTKDVEATLATMVEDAFVNHVSVSTGGRLLLRRVHPFMARRSPDAAAEPRRGDNQIVDELHASSTHTKQMDWFLPGVPPTNRKVEIDLVVVVQFRDGRIACERIYWDHATVLRQVDLL